MSYPCQDGHVIHPPGRLPNPSVWKGCPPVACQFCRSTRLDFQAYGDNYAWCADCRRESGPVSRTACWAAMKILRDLGGNAQTWNPLREMVEQLHASKATADGPDLDLTFPKMSHAAYLALRALTCCDRDWTLALALLQEWAARTCEQGG